MIVEINVSIPWAICSKCYYLGHPCAAKLIIERAEWCTKRSIRYAISTENKNLWSDLEFEYKNLAPRWRGDTCKKESVVMGEIILRKLSAYTCSSYAGSVSSTIQSIDTSRYSSSKNWKCFVVVHCTSMEFTRIDEDQQLSFVNISNDLRKRLSICWDASLPHEFPRQNDDFERVSKNPRWTEFMYRNAHFHINLHFSVHWDTFAPSFTAESLIPLSLPSQLESLSIFLRLHRQ